MSLFTKTKEELEIERFTQLPEATAPKSKFKHELTEQQQAIIERFSGSSFAYKAFAGCSKTTVVEAAIPELCKTEVRDPVLVCSFSNAITDDIKRKVNALGLINVKVGTIHSDAMETLRRLGFRYKLSKYKGTEVSEIIFSRQNSIDRKFQFSCIVQAAKACSLHKLTNENPFIDTDLGSVITEYGLIPTGVDFEQFEMFVNDVYAEQLRLAGLGICDFDDMIIVATEFAKSNKQFSKFKTVIVDEGQDCNEAQLQYFKAIKADRYIFSYDNYQRIYGFQGAVENLEERMSSLYGISDILKLNNSFRCPHSISKFIRQHYVDDFYSYHANPEGSCEEREDGEFLELAKSLPDLFILGRSNASLLKYFLLCLQANIPAVLEKSNIDNLINSIFMDCSKRGITIEQRLNQKISDIHRNPYSEFRKQVFIRSETDNHKAARILFDYLQQPTYGMAANKLQVFFGEAEKGNSDKLFVTMHRSKGRQRSNGIILPYQVRSEDQEEKICLPYVGFSRFTNSVFNLIEMKEETI